MDFTALFNQIFQVFCLYVPVHSIYEHFRKENFSFTHCFFFSECFVHSKYRTFHGIFCTPFFLDFTLFYRGCYYFCFQFCSVFFDYYVGNCSCWLHCWFYCRHRQCKLYRHSWFGNHVDYSCSQF